MTNGNVATELTDRIVVRWVEEYWTEHEKPLLLSQLGGLENGEIATLTKQESGSLKALCLPFISSGVHQERRPVRRHW